MEKRNLTANELAVRWSVTIKTLRQWRWNGKGPPYFKIGGRALYRLEQIEDFEKARESTERNKNNHIAQCD